MHTLRQILVVQMSRKDVLEGKINQERWLVSNGEKLKPKCDNNHLDPEHESKIYLFTKRGFS